jgi:hypothetical protein
VKGEGEVGLKKKVSWYSKTSNDGGLDEGIIIRVKKIVARRDQRKG